MSKEKSIDEFRNITRMEYPRKGRGYGATVGWWVRVMRGSKMYSKLFSDGKYGGKEKALKKAKKYRDKITEEHHSLLRKGYYTFKSDRNTSGIVGVHRGFKVKKKPSGREYTYYVWIATWVEPVTGKIKNRSFSISKHGEAGALKLALEAREEAIALIAGQKRKHTSIWGDFSLQELVQVVENAQTSNEKGRALEELIVRLFNEIPDFTVNDIRVRTETEEIDIVLLNNSDDPRYRRESALLLVECKNWSSKIGKNEFVIFKEKIENRRSRCTLGFLISWNGFTDTFTKEMLRGSREQVLVIPIDGKDIILAIQKQAFAQALLYAFDDAVNV